MMTDAGYEQRFGGIGVQVRIDPANKRLTVMTPIPGSPAYKAGIQPGDIIVEFDGQKIERSSDLPPLVGMTPVGKTVPVTVLRNGKRKVIHVTVGSKSASSGKRGEGVRQQAVDVFGAVVEDLTAEERKELGVRYGVRVVEVDGGPAEASGLQPGDIIVSIAFKPIRDTNMLYALVKKLPKGKKFPMRIIRRGNSLFLPLIME